jgi:glycosyltransferase involved in cell wall biosynthesis
MKRGEIAAAPWLTVIMPCYCGERWIDRALRSIAAESADGIEVLLIDGSPTSATREIAYGYSDRINLRVYERPDLKMWHDKTNFGVAIANAQHICWLHVDDLWFGGRAAAVRAWIGKAPEASLHLSPSAIMDQLDRKLGVWRCPLPADCELRSDLVREKLLVQNFVAAPAPVFRKDAWLACGGLDTQLWYTGDWDIWLKLATRGSVYYHDDITTGFRIHGSSLTATGSRDLADFTRQMEIVLDRHLARPSGRPNGLERIARASIAVNTALALSSSGDLTGLPRAMYEVLRLGPIGIYRYVHYSRIMDRVKPRLRAKLSGVW